MSRDKAKCFICGGTGKISYYFNAGDHFSAGPAPDSEWRTEVCTLCLGTGKSKAPKKNKKEKGNGK